MGRQLTEALDLPVLVVVCVCAGICGEGAKVRFRACVSKCGRARQLEREGERMMCLLRLPA